MVSVCLAGKGYLQVLENSNAISLLGRMGPIKLYQTFQALTLPTFREQEAARCLPQIPLPLRILEPLPGPINHCLAGS